MAKSKGRIRNNQPKELKVWEKRKRNKARFTLYKQYLLFLCIPFYPCKSSLLPHCFNSQHIAFYSLNLSPITFPKYYLLLQFKAHSFSLYDHQTTSVCFFSYFISIIQFWIHSTFIHHPFILGLALVLQPTLLKCPIHTAFNLLLCFFLSQLSFQENKMGRRCF